MQMQEKDWDNQKQEYLKALKVFLIWLGVIFLLLCFLSSCFQLYRIPSGSMVPTLLVGDLVLVDKAAFGLKVPFSDKGAEPIYLTKNKAVRRGDILVFSDPKRPSITLIKRVVGLPGDEIRYQGSRIWVNKSEVESRPFDLKNFPKIEKRYFQSGEEPAVISLESIEHLGLVGRRGKPSGRITVPEDEYFMLGDNRQHSHDSRIWGPISFHLIKGRAVKVIGNYKVGNGGERPQLYNQKINQAATSSKLKSK